jgi:hypothetical protein
MRAASLILVLTIMTLPAQVRAEPTSTAPSAATESNDAGWADTDAKARIIDGDYDGAVQAQQTADAARKQADEQPAHARNRVPAASLPPSAQTAH